MSRSLIAPLAIAVFAVVAAGALAAECGGDGDVSRASRGAPAPARIPALAVSPTPTPPLRLANYETRGTYPEVSAADGLEAVNAALFREHARRELLDPGPGVVPGWERRRRWMSTTLRVPSGESVAFTDLFADHSLALRAIAAAARADVVKGARRSCVADSLADRTVGFLRERRMRPLARNYRHFELAPEGLAFGFYQSQIAAPPGGRISTVVPHRVVRPYLNREGRSLIAGVRRPA
ncbi:MAG TPA: hypothetical protein VGW10_05090 [Solirubrobacteraceae bacterium]|nr:hypothetical protein [Solirubrobacteraceae bacterium]